ncbi:MAG: glycosyltransferase [Patescibacteria group bacterium]
MKIVFLTTLSLEQSTVIGRVLPLAKEFKKMGHEVTILLHKELSSRPPSRDPGASTIITGINPFTRTKDGKKRLTGLRLLLRLKINALRAAWHLLRVHPDTIILVKPLPENTLAACIAKLLLWKTKIILDVDDYELFANNLSSLLQRAVIHVSERIAASLSSHITVATPFLYYYMHQMVAGNKDVTLIPTGLSAIAPAEGGATADLLSRDSNNNTILYIGSISIVSGHRVDLLPEILLHARKQIPDAHLMIAGTGDDEIELKKQFQGLSLEHAVTYFGKFTGSDVPKLLAHCDVMIDPIDASIVNRSKSSFRTTLALANGKPLVTSSIGIRTDMIPSILHEKFFAIPEDSASYAEKIIALLKTPLSDTEKNMMHEQSEKYTWEQLAKKYNKIFV